LLEVLGTCAGATWPTDPVFGETTVNIGVIAGGTRPNVVAADAPGRPADPARDRGPPVKALLERAVRDRARSIPDAVPPLRLTRFPGSRPASSGSRPISITSQLGHPLLLGPGSILDAHTAHERISVAELAQGVDAYVRLVHTLSLRKGRSVKVALFGQARWDACLEESARAAGLEIGVIITSANVATPRGSSPATAWPSTSPRRRRAGPVEPRPRRRPLVEALPLQRGGGRSAEGVEARRRR